MMKDPVALQVNAYYLEQQSNAQLAVTVVGLAVERFRLRNRRLPEKLKEDLVPMYIERIPLDPYTRKPVKFKKVEGGYCVYSVGADRIDDGGQEKNDEGHSFRPGSDILFTVVKPGEP